MARVIRDLLEKPQNLLDRPVNIVVRRHPGAMSLRSRLQEALPVETTMALARARREVAASAAGNVGYRVRNRTHYLNTLASKVAVR
jgi:hypothetical protein